MAAIDLNSLARRSTPVMPAGLQPSADNLTGLAVRPNDPRIPPPQEDGTHVEVQTDDEIAIAAAIDKVQAELQAGRPVERVVEAVKPAPVFDKRVVLSYGRETGTVVLAIETAPDWDVADDGSFIVSQDAVRELLPVLRLLTKIKNLAPGLLDG